MTRVGVFLRLGRNRKGVPEQIVASNSEIVAPRSVQMRLVGVLDSECPVRPLLAAGDLLRETPAAN